MNSIKYLTGISIVGLILILSLSANVSATPQITIGNAVGYTIVVRNLGNMTAHHVTVDDILPEDISVMNEGSWRAIYNQNSFPF